MAKEYVKILNDDLVSYILDWQEHNSIRADRKVNSIYIDLLKSSIPNIKLVEPKTRSDLKNKQTNKAILMDNQRTAGGQPMDGPSKSGQSTDNQWTVHGQQRVG